jgi:NAD(P)H dehydrogenase (quinone)
MKIAIVYHSGYGHTKMVAEHIQKGASKELRQVFLLSVLEAQDNFDLLHQAETLVFGCPTYMGSVSAEFKKFMEVTGKFWYQQKWKDKFAAGFTNSSTANGDKLNTLQQLSIFAAQHSMLWISSGILPKFESDKQLEEPSGLGSYLGLMTLSDNSSKELNPPKGLQTAELFGQRIAQITGQIKQSIKL